MKKLNLEQGSEEWKMARLGKISGTRLASAIGSKAKQETLMNEMIAEKVTGEPLPHFVSGAMQRGTDAEEFAIGEYEKRSGNKVDTVGMCIADDSEWLSNSPDGLIGEDGAVEIKCPNTVKVIKYYRDGGVPKDYYPQCLSYFMVNEKLKWLDFVVYDPRINESHLQMLIVRLERNEIMDDIENAWEKAFEFIDYYKNEVSLLGIGF